MIIWFQFISIHASTEIASNSISTVVTTSSWSLYTLINIWMKVEHYVNIIVVYDSSQKNDVLLHGNLSCIYILINVSKLILIHEKTQLRCTRNEAHFIAQWYWYSCTMCFHTDKTVIYGHVCLYILKANMWFCETPTVQVSVEAKRLLGSGN